MSDVKTSNQCCTYPVGDCIQAPPKDPSVQRFSGWGLSMMQQKPTTEYVLASDYDALVTRLAALQGETGANELYEIAREISTMDCFYSGATHDPDCKCIVGRAERAINNPAARLLHAPHTKWPGEPPHWPSCECGAPKATDETSERRPHPNLLKPIASEWATEKNDAAVTVHHCMVEGVLCRWWGDGPTPKGVAIIDRAIRDAKDTGRAAWDCECNTLECPYCGPRLRRIGAVKAEAQSKPRAIAHEPDCDWKERGTGCACGARDAAKTGGES